MSHEDVEREAERLDRLEMRHAEHERGFEDLDAAVRRQWIEIEALQRQVARLLDRLAEAERRLPAEPDAPPPHY